MKTNSQFPIGNQVYSFAFKWSEKIIQVVVTTYDLSYIAGCGTQT